jgi:translation initiation factor IF-3
LKKPLTNKWIRAKEIRLVDEEGKQLGLMPTEEAIKLAEERQLDLIQVTEKVEPPVCKLGDYGKYLYREGKKEKTINKQKSRELKGIRLTFKISEHDLETRVHQAEKFIKKGHKVKVELLLKGREKALQEFAKEKIEKFLEKLNEAIPVKIEKELKKEPRGFTTIIMKKE